MSQPRTRVRSVTVRRRAQAAWPRTASARGETAAKENKTTQANHTIQANQTTQAATTTPARQTDALTQSLGFGERMLRNTAVCVALLLCVLAARSVSTDGDSLLEQVVTMDLSESLGSLRFVSNLVPESAAVFWNLGVERHGAPSEAAVAHVFSASEPWTAYGQGEARASAAGEVMSVSVTPDGLGSLRLRHASGMETLYGGLSRVAVREGDWVQAGQTLGEGQSVVYELRLEGRAVNPAGYWD